MGKWAVAMRMGADGRPKVVAAGQGAQAEAIVAKAQASGVDVRQDAEMVNELLQSEPEGARIDSRIYELMTTIVNFAQELDQAWVPPAEFEEN